MHYLGAKTGRLYPACRLLAQAGEGSVFETTDRHALLKVYTAPPDARTVEKLRLLADLPRKTPNAALPIELLLDPASGTVVGYVQPYYRGASPVTRFLDPTWRKKQGVPDDLFSLVALARALAEAVAQLHAAQLVMGDVSDSNFLARFRRWSARPTVYVIDCGSVQLSRRSPAGLDVYVSGVGTEAYVAPEVQGTDWGTSERTVYSDSFGTVVLFWRLLFRSSHPFAVVSPPDQDPPPLGQRIQNRQFPFRPAAPLPSGWKPAPLTPPLDVLPAEIQELFFRTIAAADPRDRPLVGTIARALRQWEKALRPSLAMRIARVLHSRAANGVGELWPPVRPWAVRGGVALILAALLGLLPRTLPPLPRLWPAQGAPSPAQSIAPAPPPRRPPRPRVVDESLFPKSLVNDLVTQPETRRE